MFTYSVNDDISLKILERKDAEKLFMITNQSRQSLKEWLPWLDTVKRQEDSLSFIELTLKGMAENRSMTTAIIYKKELVGIAGYNEINWSNQTAYIGYWLADNFQGKGIMTSVAIALTNYAFQECHLNKVEIRAAVGNKKSRRIPEKLGYTEEGCIRQAEWLYDHYVDHVVYGVLKHEWEEQRNTV